LAKEDERTEEDQRPYFQTILCCELESNCFIGHNIKMIRILFTVQQCTNLFLTLPHMTTFFYTNFLVAPWKRTQIILKKVTNQIDAKKLKWL